ncbi:MAG: membrane protein insertase YidC [Bacilli bacterium]|nr:membrane protein insertase YidC [Bacilli bacterium]
MKNTKKVLLVLLVVIITMTGCTKQIQTEDKKRVQNDQTGQTLTSNILCLPKDEQLLNKYTEYKDRLDVDMDKLVTCDRMSAWKTDKYDGIWTQIFVQPLSWLILYVGQLVGNYGISVMIIGALIRVLILPFTIKSTKQTEAMKKIQPEMERLERKYAGKDDQQSQMAKSQEMMMIYKKHNVNPLGSCLIMLIQLPVFFAFLEAINRTPAIFENSLWKFQLGTTPLFGIQHGNYWYILLLILIMLFTILTFMQSQASMGNSKEQKGQQRMMTIMMIGFIGIASINLPSAIALYWVVTNVFSVVQTFIIKKVGNK